MRILFLCHRWPYPPKGGAKIRSFNIISHLSKSHEVIVASLIRSDQEAKEGKGLEEHCHAAFAGHMSIVPTILRMAGRLPTSVPLSMGYFFNPELKRHVDGILKEMSIDLIFVHCSSVAQYVNCVTGIPKVLDFADMDSQKWLAYSKYKMFPLSLGYLFEGMKLQAAERKLASQFDLCTCTTRMECETLNSYGTNTPTDWFPNGVDYDYFLPSQDYDERLISFIGRMDYFPNQQCMLDFCRHTLPRIQARIPDTKLVIVGADPSREILALNRLPGVKVTGSVDDVRPYVRRSAVNVTPLTIARGTQNKILEAMAMGVPVVASALAAGGIDALAPDHLLIADGAEDFSEAVISVLTNTRERQRLSQAGRDRVCSHHDWTHSMKRLDGLIEKCLIAQRH